MKTKINHNFIDYFIHFLCVEANLNVIPCNHLGAWTLFRRPPDSDFPTLNEFKIDNGRRHRYLN